MDLPDTSSALALADRLGDSVSFYKLGRELFMDGGYFQLVDRLTAPGKRVFVDLKFFDVPETVGRAVRRLGGRGVTFCTVHGNDAMLAAACSNRGNVKILTVTALTSLDRGDLDGLGFACDPRELVLSRALRAFEIGSDGVVSSGLEERALRQHVDSRLLVITPGIRPVENRPGDDQERTVDVRQAFLNGADHIVVGRPIRDAADPRAAAESIQDTIAQVFVGSGPCPIPGPSVTCVVCVGCPRAVLSISAAGLGLTGGDSSIAGQLQRDAAVAKNPFRLGTYYEALPP